MRFVNYIKKYWSEVLATIFIIGIIWFLIFYWYPIYLKHVFNYHNPTSDLSHEAEGFGRGTFGDMYGPLNTFVSGLASLGAVIAVLVQIGLFKIDKDILKKEKNEISFLLIKYFKSNLNSLNIESVIPLRARLNKIITSKFSMRETYIDAKLDASTDYYFRALLSTSRDEIFKAYHSTNHPKADKIIEIYYKIELLHSNFKDLMNLITITRKELKQIQSEIHNLKVEILLVDKRSENKFSFLNNCDLFSTETLSLLEEKVDWQSPNFRLTSLIDLLDSYFWKKSAWESQITSLHKELVDFLDLTENL
ncbi:hypothetical protein [Cellulophaga sp. BC115SP]|uniref:hypothetical protein n=1 Tax=Cellulophaga sp. BC115SP TaxID=2683263 RepID=UPI001413080A|nr:hypothetical protein [Cellulophaga sp. BC115SP]NBB31537.1 hypothetical protein [Cellulophaga sp. BC115SP]